ncbi:MAG TPA: transaldolase family protein, partial [Actinomycetota bacterium]|nr:transaldolase family protein [Actinomycetota bacterium]
MNPLLELGDAGQSVWLDFLRRGLITGGGLERLIDEDGLSGVTSNPSIFRKAISGSTDYDQPVRALVEKGTTEPRAIFYDLALDDIQMAADLFRLQFDSSGGARGFVSFELEAAIAHDTAASIAKAKELFARIDRPNVMIKVPGTAEGVPAVEELTAAGIN